MSGHSKWKNIQHRKGRQDEIRGRLFTKISREIFVAVRSGGSDPATNARLKMALNKAKSVNMPSDNVERTIKKALGELDNVQYEEILYEGYGPGGVAVMVEVLTDNRNRSAAEIRHIFAKRGGNLGESGCVVWMFARKGVLVVEKESLPGDEDEWLLTALDAGAEDVNVHANEVEVITPPDQYEEVLTALENGGWFFSSTEVTFVPQNTVPLSGEEVEQIFSLLETLEENDDVQNVISNAEWPEEAN